VVPPEDDAEIGPARPRLRRAGGPWRICAIGGIGIEKGYDVLLACARDAAARALPLEFVVVGHTTDDARLMATGRVFVTGFYKAGEAVPLICAQEADLAFLPSIVPETWCFTLTEAWQAGLDVVAFDVGAQAERIKERGAGSLIPLWLSSNAVNDALLAAARKIRHEGAAIGAAA
jgi:glycosyltransferase involved in cell wall biosynthesis